MSEAEDLYRGVLLERGRHPVNLGPLPSATHSAEGYSPLCGDRLTVRAEVKDGRFEALRFEGHACIVAVASASMMTEHLADQEIESVDGLLDQLRELLANDDSTPSQSPIPLAFAALLPVQRYPLRRRCATLAWETLAKALQTSTGTEPGTPAAKNSAVTTDR
jgi:nitrogen fixation NifU-like protein